MFFFSFFVQAQETEMKEHDHYHQHVSKAETFVISYGEKLLIPKEQKYYNQLQWKVFNPDQSLLKEGTGSGLSDIVFDIPGKYTIITNVASIKASTSPNICIHTDFADSYLVAVTNIHIKPQFENIKFSSPIIGGQDTSNVILNFPIEVEIFDKTSVSLAQMKISTSGVETTITGSIINQTSVKEGVNILQFQLNGKAKKGTYIQFNFVEPSGIMHSKSYSTFIQ
jgi:hypothetical protein